MPGLSPSYDQRRFDPADWRNRLLIVASGAGQPGAVTLNADATIWRAQIQRGHSVCHATVSGRAVMIYVAGGRVRVNDESLADGDQLRAEGETEFDITADADADLILIDAGLAVPACRASHQQGIAMVGRMPNLEKIDNLVCLGAIADGYLDEIGEFRPGESWSECATRVGNRLPDLAMWLRQADARWDALEAALKIKPASGTGLS